MALELSQPKIGVLAGSRPMTGSFKNDRGSAGTSDVGSAGEPGTVTSAGEQGVASSPDGVPKSGTAPGAGGSGAVSGSGADPLATDSSVGGATRNIVHGDSTELGADFPHEVRGGGGQLSATT